MAMYMYRKDMGGRDGYVVDNAQDNIIVWIKFLRISMARNNQLASFNWLNTYL